MKKYIKYFNEREQKMKRIVVNENTTVNTIMHSDCMEVQIIGQEEGKTLLTVYLHIGKELEKFCGNILYCHLNPFFEKMVRKNVSKDLAEFLSNYRHTLPVDKVSSDWNTNYNLNLAYCQLTSGEKMEELAGKFRTLFGD